MNIEVDYIRKTSAMIGDSNAIQPLRIDRSGKESRLLILAITFDDGFHVSMARSGLAAIREGNHETTVARFSRPFCVPNSALPV
jgi:hypothetical protein